MGLLRRVKSLGNTAHAIHGPRNPKPSNPIKTGKRMATHVQAPHKPDSSPFGLRAAQLANAKTAMASGMPARYPAKKPINRATRATAKANFAGYVFPNTKRG